MPESVPLILIVDDDPSMRRLLSTLLRSEGYDVEQASGGPEGLEKLTSKPDMLLLDLMMPGMNGEEVFVAARALNFTEPVMFLSASTQLRAIAQRLACDFLAKPFATDLLLDKVALLVPFRD